MGDSAVETRKSSYATFHQRFWTFVFVLSETALRSGRALRQPTTCCFALLCTATETRLSGLVQYLWSSIRHTFAPEKVIELEFVARNETRSQLLSLQVLQLSHLTHPLFLQPAMDALFLNLVAFTGRLIVTAEV